jgi:hypothetical protein
MLDGRDAQRPIIWATNDRAQIYWQPISREGFGVACWTWHYKNFGPGIALNVVLDGNVSVVGPYQKGADFTSDPNPVVMPPDDSKFTTTCSEAAMTKAEFDALGKADNSIILQAVITYDDAYGSSFRSPICQSQLSSGAISTCKADGFR